jgi:hypothetical protein
MLRMAFDRTKSFGGKSVILLGDFCQISPIKNTSLADVLVSYASAVKKSKSSLTPKDHVFQQAGALLSQFRRSELKANVRAQSDQVHQNLLDRLTLL